MEVTFSPQTTQDWYKQIEKDLKGKPLEEILAKNYENILIKPFFLQEDINKQFAEQVNSLLRSKTFTQLVEAELPSSTESDLLCRAIQNETEIDENEIVSFLEKIASQEKFFIDISLLHNAGANAIQELAFALAATNFYLIQATEKKQTENLLSKLGFLVAVGSNFFMEIAKLRVLPYLINRLVSMHSPEKQDFIPFVKAQTAQINKSRQDAYNNIIRATLEAMAANIACVDAIQIFPHDYWLGSQDSFSENIAVNIQRILHYEAKIDFVKDISAGTYFVEYLCYQLAQKAWEMFGRIEKEGGVVNFWKKGLLKQEILQIAEQKIKDFREKKIVLIGVNKYPNPTENIATETKTWAYLAEGKAIRTFRLEEFL